MKNVTTLLFCAALLWAAPASASEELKLEEAKWTFDDKGKAAIKAYQTASKAALVKLDGFVNKTMEGEEYLDAQWEGVCRTVADKLTAVNGFKKGYAKDVLTWLKEEQKAWANIRTIGQRMIATHYTMASTVDQIETDIKHSELFYKAYKTRMTVVNLLANRIAVKFGEVELEQKDMTKLKTTVGFLKGSVKQMELSSSISLRILRSFRDKAYKFIKQKDLVGKYRTDLARLKSKKIDPDGSGVFYTHEVKWEEVMYKTYQRYIKAVDKWKKTHKWIQKGDFEKLMNTVAPKVVGFAGKKLLGLPIAVPLHEITNPEKTGDLCLELKAVVLKAWEKAKGAEWARLEKEILTAEEERKNANAEAQVELEKLEVEASERAGKVDETVEKQIATIKKKLTELHAELGKTTDDSKSKSILAKIKELEGAIKLQEAACIRDKKYWHDEWLDKKQNEVFTKLRAKVKEIDDRIAKYKTQFPKD